MDGAICPACGCSLVRLGIPRTEAVSTTHGGHQHYFCCQGCADLFTADPEHYLAEISDWIVCPTCLAEKPRAMAVSIEHDGERIWFCRCPCCLDEFKKRPAELSERMAG